MFKYIRSLFRAINANANPGDIAHAVSLGLLLALVPRANLLWAFLFFLTLFIRVNKGAFFISLVLLSFVTPLADVLLEPLGYRVLSFAPLQGAYHALYRTPFVGLTRFNNTLVAGSFAAGIVLYVPAFFLFRFLVQLYRAKLQPHLAQSKFVKFLGKLPLLKNLIDSPVSGGFDR